MSRGPLLALLMVACEPAPAVGEPAIEERAPPTTRIEARAPGGPAAREPASSRVLRLGHGVLAADPFARRPASPGGPWYPATGWMFVDNFLRIDEEAYWLPTGDGLLRIPRSRDLRWVRDGFPCAGWLIGEQDDLLWCAAYADERDAVTITALDKSGFSEPSVVARLPIQTEYPSSLHISLEGQGPFIVGDRVMMPVDSGFVGAALDGDGALSFIALGQRPYAVVAHGDRVAWTDRARTELYAGQLPLSVVRREYVDSGAAMAPEWAGESLVFKAVEGGTERLLRLTADGRLLVILDLPRGQGRLIGGGERAWLLVDDDTMVWIDETSHGPAVSLGGVPVAHDIGSDAGVLYWDTVEHEGSALHVSDVDRGGVVSLCGGDCVDALAQDPAAFAADRLGDPARSSYSLVRVQPTATVGPLDSGVVDDVVGDHRIINALTDCHQAALVSFPALQGRFIARFTVDREGRVVQPTVDPKSELSGPIMRECVFKAMRRWRFPADGAAPTTVRLPLDFWIRRR